MFDRYVRSHMVDCLHQLVAQVGCLVVLVLALGYLDVLAPVVTMTATAGGPSGSVPKPAESQTSQAMGPTWDSAVIAALLGHLVTQQRQFDLAKARYREARAIYSTCRSLAAQRS